MKSNILFTDLILITLRLEVNYLTFRKISTSGRFVNERFLTSSVKIVFINLQCSAVVGFVEPKAIPERKLVQIV